MTTFQDIPNEDMVLCYCGLGCIVLLHDPLFATGSIRSYRYYFTTNREIPDLEHARRVIPRKLENWTIVRKRDGKLFDCTISIALPGADEADQEKIGIRFWV
jgi:hypothetical protein